MREFFQNLLPIVCFLVVIIIVIEAYLYFTNVNRYVPTVSITASSDGGKTYSDILKSLPRDKDIYLKYEVSIKAKGFSSWFPWFHSTVTFTIDYPKEFELHDYTGKRKMDDTKQIKNYLATVTLSDTDVSTYRVRVSALKNSTNLSAGDYTVSILPSGNEYEVLVSEEIKTNKRTVATFMAPSSSPKKTEIILKLPPYDSGKYGENKDKRRLMLSFSRLVSDIYSRTITLDFASPESSDKKEQETSTGKQISITGNIGITGNINEH